MIDPSYVDYTYFGSTVVCLKLERFLKPELKETSDKNSNKIYNISIRSPSAVLLFITEDLSGNMIM